MAILSAFNFITLNGYFQGPQAGDISWHHHDSEAAEYSAKASGQEHILLFGHTTYDMMASFWPTEMAAQQFPEVARNMNAAEKVVISRTLDRADWEHTRVINDNVVENIRALKQGNKAITILGSGSILSLCAEHGLLDQFVVMIDPVALGEGFPIFKGVSKPLKMELKESRVFDRSGIVLLTYKVF